MLVGLLEPPGRSGRLPNEESQTRLLNFFAAAEELNGSDEIYDKQTSSKKNFIERLLLSNSTNFDYSEEWTREFLKRPTWFDADISLQLILQGAIKGRKLPLYSRLIVQRVLEKIGNIVQFSPIFIILFMTTLFSICCFGLRYMRVETDIIKLWVPEDGRLHEEMNFFSNLQRSLQNKTHVSNDEKYFISVDRDPKLEQIPEDEIASSIYQVIIQTVDPTTAETNILTKDNLLEHSQLILQIKNLNVQRFGRNWTLDDICFKPGSLDIDNSSIAWSLKPSLERLIPCIWITPIDCFWEGSKPLGPTPPIDTSHLAGGLLSMFFEDIPKEATWRNINPLKIVNQVYQSFDLGTMKNFFLRTGIDQGYIDRACINPLDPECPVDSPNYFANSCRSMKLFKSKFFEPKGEKIEEVLAKYYQPEDHRDTQPSFADLFQLFASGTKNASEPKNGSESECIQHRSAFLRWLDANMNEVKHLVDKEFLPTLPNYGKIMMNGCKGVAKNIMNWPVSLILGGIYENADKMEVQAEALQSVILVASPTEVYRRFRESEFIRDLNIMDPNGAGDELNLNGTSEAKSGEDFWSPLIAKEVISAWQRRFTDFLYNHQSNFDFDGHVKERRVVHPLATVSISDMLAEYCDFNPSMIFAGYFLMLIYALYSQLRLDGCLLSVDSSVCLAFAGVLVVTFASISGLGFATWFGYSFNAVTTQVVPFLVLGIGVDNMFLLLHNYPNVTKSGRDNEIGLLLKSTGMSILMTSSNNILSFAAGTILPIPALRSFCTQCSILLTFNLIAILTIFPAIIALDLCRKKSSRRDLCCCLFSDEAKECPPQPYRFANKISQTLLTPAQDLIDTCNEKILKHGYHGLVTQGRNDDDDDEDNDIHPSSLRNLLKNYYIPFIKQKATKFCVLVFCSAMFICAIFGIKHSILGLELSDILPENTPPAAFLRERDRYFSFYPMYIVLQGENINFPEQQHLIDNLRRDIGHSKFVIKLQNGEPSERYWLSLFREWLRDLQEKLDDAERKGLLKNYDKNNSTKTSDIDLAISLTCSYGQHYNCSRVGRIKLIDETNTINAEGFYNYLYGWHEYESMFYTVSQASFYPKLRKLKQGSRERRFRYYIPPAPKPLFSRIPFYLTGLKNTTVIIEMIKELRAISDNYTNQGLPNYPEGMPFTFWDQYLDLNKNLITAICVISLAVFCVISFLLFSPSAACCVLMVLIMIAVELAGFLGLCRIKFNPVSAVSVITAIGIGVEFTIHPCFSFLTALGTRNQRMASAIDHVFVPVIHGALSTLLGIMMLAFSRFEFIFKYFFLVLSALIIIGLINGLVLLPVLLSLIGPGPEIRTTKGGNRLYLSMPLNSIHRRKRDRFSTNFREFSRPILLQAVDSFA